MMTSDPHLETERRIAARRLLARPLTCAEHDRETFALIRRHEAELDRWFTQRLGYRLHVDADTARLYKTGVSLARPLHRPGRRSLHQHECVLLALVLAATAAGPAVISLRDLIEAVRSAAAEAQVDLTDDAAQRRALVTAIQWMIDHGLAEEMYANVDAYAADDAADAVLRMRPDRIALLPLPSLIGASTATELLERAERRPPVRQWMRALLTETPVLYRDDLADDEWAELRRRLGEEERVLAEMFGLTVEARAEGVAAVDPTGALSGTRFPAGGTVGHAALLILGDRSVDGAITWPDLVALVADLATTHRRNWANDLVDAPERLARLVTELLIEMRLAALEVGTVTVVRLLPAAARFRIADRVDETATVEQDALW